MSRAQSAQGCRRIILQRKPDWEAFSQATAFLEDLQTKLEADNARDLLHVSLAELANQSHEAIFAHGGDLVGHGLTSLPVQRDRAFGWIEASYLARYRDDLHPVEESVRRIVADDNGWAGLPDLAADCGWE
jgi:hypothetical protein